MKLAVRSLFFCPNIIHPETVIRDISSDTSWCFRPLFIWMRILGIDLYPISRKSIRRYGLVMLLMGTWAEIELIFDVFRKLLSLKLASSTTSNWNIAIDYINNFCFIVFVSLIIFYVARNRCNTVGLYPEIRVELRLCAIHAKRVTTYHHAKRHPTRSSYLW